MFSSLGAERTEPSECGTASASIPGWGKSLYF
jgi:hypothetical protein